MHFFLFPNDRRVRENVQITNINNIFDNMFTNY